MQWLPLGTVHNVLWATSYLFIQWFLPACLTGSSFSALWMQKCSSLSVGTAALSTSAGLFFPGALHEGINGLLLLKFLSVLDFSVAIRGKTSLHSLPLRSILGEVSLWLVRLLCRFPLA